MFFHKYFSQKNEKERAKAEKIAKRKGTGKDDDEVEDDQEDSDLEEDEEDATERKDQDEEEVDDEDSEEEAEIWKAMKATNPDLQPGGDDDIDDFSEDSEDSEDYSLDDDEGEEEEPTRDREGRGGEDHVEVNVCPAAARGEGGEPISGGATSTRAEGWEAYQLIRGPRAGVFRHLPLVPHP